MTIALYTLTSSLHSEAAGSAASEPFIRSVESALCGSFEFCGEDYSSFGSHNADLIYVRTGGTEGMFKDLKLWDRASRFLLLTSGKSNSLAASMEILSFLNQNGLEGEILHGSADFIAERIRETCSCHRSGAGQSVTQYAGEEVSPSGRRFIAPFPATDLGGVKLGVIGKPSDWLISSDVDYAKAKSRLGIEIVDIPMSELLGRLPANSQSNSAVSAGIRGKSMDMRSFDGSVAIYDALRGIVRDFGLGGLTIRCFDLLDSVHNTGCLALARLNAEGIPSSCEGDIPALISMVYLQRQRGCPGFQCNLSRIDGDELLFAHCTVPLSMVSTFSYATHFESGIGTAIKGELPECDVEIFKIAPDLEHCVRIPGRIVRNCSEPALCRTQIIVKAPGAADYLLRYPLANHHIISFL